MKIAVVTAGSPDFAELASITNPSKERYAKLHGYDFHYFETNKEDGDMCKFLAYKSLMGKGYDVMMWSDLDAQVQASHWRVEDILAYGMGWDPANGIESNCHFLWGFDANGPNSGVYFARFTSQAFHFMERYTNNMLENGLGDNTSMIHTSLMPPFNEWVKCVRGTLFNAYPYEAYGWDKYAHADMINKYRPGCFVMQIPGLPNEVRIPLLKKYAEEAT